jgi:hypothetical protein
MKETNMANRIEIEITVCGGLVQNITGIPPGVFVTVRDYDCDMNDRGAELDDNDEPCVVSFWEHVP